MLFAHVCENICVRTDPKSRCDSLQLGAAAQPWAHIQTLMTVSTGSQPATSTVVPLPEHTTGAWRPAAGAQRKREKASEEGRARP